MKQLKMIRPDAPVAWRPLPEGFCFEAFSDLPEQVSDWLAICRHGLLPDDGKALWFDECIRRYPDLTPEADLFFVTAPDGRRVATSASVKHPNGEGYIHMVAALPDCRGRGIGHAMLSRALAMLASRGCTHTVLTTDDHRLPAIKTYLDAGFRPVLVYDPDSDMRARWDAVIAALRYEPVSYMEEV